MTYYINFKNNGPKTKKHVIDENLVIKAKTNKRMTKATTFTVIETRYYLNIR